MSAIWTAEGTGEAANLNMGIRFRHEPGDTLDIDVWNDDDGESGVNIDRDEAKGLYQSLGEWLVATEPEPQSGNPA